MDCSLNVKRKFFAICKSVVLRCKELNIYLISLTGKNKFSVALVVFVAATAVATVTIYVYLNVSIKPKSTSVC